MGQIFTDCAYDYDVADAIKDGWLVPILRAAADRLPVSATPRKARIRDQSRVSGIVAIRY